ncbi:hypothetical protein C5689_07960 [Methylosinus sporium]|uniref:Uncharacterized protein n=1 Tax=Methylosinus sporium TaxID=428 RepID=A0A2U1SS57_METSR|nr:hypothetical protein C5689_07960 [Methylosinus sporium]
MTRFVENLAPASSARQGVEREGSARRHARGAAHRNDPFRIDVADAATPARSEFFFKRKPPPDQGSALDKKRAILRLAVGRSAISPRDEVLRRNSRRRNSGRRNPGAKVEARPRTDLRRTSATIGTYSRPNPIPGQVLAPIRPTRDIAETEWS